MYMYIHFVVYAFMQLQLLSALLEWIFVNNSGTCLLMSSVAGAAFALLLCITIDAHHAETNKLIHTQNTHSHTGIHTYIHTLTYLYAYTHSSNNKNNCTLCTHLIILVNIIAASYSVAQG